MVYFIRDTITGAIKIGSSDRPLQRLSHLQTACPHPLELLGTMPGGPLEERQLHARFSPLRQQGEWFRGDPALIGHVSRLVKIPGLSADPEAPATDPRSASVSVEFFRDQRVMEPELCYLTSMAVGFVVSVYRFGIPGIMEPIQYQVMRWGEGPGPGYRFWNWYLWERPQWFDSPALACTTFVAEHHKWSRMARAAREAKAS